MEYLIDRRRGERRAGTNDLRMAPGGVDRRSGRDRRVFAVTAVAAAGLATLFASPADAGRKTRIAVAATPSPTPPPTNGGLPAPTPTPTPSPSGVPTTNGGAVNPLSGAQWYVDPNSHARQQATAWRTSRPADAAQMDKIAATGGQAKWFGDWSSDVQASVDSYVTKVRATAALPVLVAYNIPNRDCGQHSGGGAADGPAYREWIRRFALGIAGRPAIVVLEPDAIGHLSQCGTEAERQERIFLLWDAVQVLKADAGTRVYIDTGHSGWLTPAVAAERLQAAGVAQADGFATNVSNFNPTAKEITYGTTISGLLGGKHFVVDTSRNGLGPASTWCNPSGQALGSRPTAATGVPNLDAFLWIKHPGQSDGTCAGGPSAGTWWADYALGLAQRAAY